MHEQPLCLLRALELTLHLCFALMRSGNPGSKRYITPLKDNQNQNCAFENVLKEERKRKVWVPILAKGWLLLPASWYPVAFFPVAFFDWRQLAVEMSTVVAVTGLPSSSS